MSTKNPKHIHKYYKAKVTFTASGFVWACALANCNHHMPEHFEVTLPGKHTKCWACEQNTVLDTRTMLMDKPLCEDCDPDYVRIDDPDLMEKLIKAGLVVPKTENE
jgi:hypothetical protein